MNFLSPVPVHDHLNGGLVVRDLPVHHGVEEQAPYDKRTPHAFRRRGTTAAGSLRLIGPAVPRRIKRNMAGKPVSAVGILVKCVNSKYAALAPADAPKTTCKKGDNCGCSRSITVPAEQIPNSYEPTLWGTNHWASNYFRRNLVESYNAVEKHHYGIGRHAIRVHAPRVGIRESDPHPRCVVHPRAKLAT